MDGPQVRKRLIIFSDFIEEDGKLDFMTDPRLAFKKRAREFAAQLGKGTPRLRGIPIFLGQLQSTEWRRISNARSEAIRIFWLNYFREKDANPELILDGPGLSLMLQAESIYQLKPVSVCSERDTLGKQTTQTV